MKPTGVSSNERQLAWWACDAVVYFVAAGSPPVSLKIGVTTWKTVGARLRAIQSANHECIELLGVIPFRGIPQPMKAAEDREREIHLLFSALQRAKPGQRGQEWFTATTELLEFVKTTAQPAADFGFPLRAR